MNITTKPLTIAISSRALFDLSEENEINETFFLRCMEKTQILQAFKPRIFFDDQSKTCDLAAKVVPTARVFAG